MDPLELGPGTGAPMDRPDITKNETPNKRKDPNVDMVSQLTGLSKSGFKGSYTAATPIYISDHTATDVNE